MKRQFDNIDQIIQFIATYAQEEDINKELGKKGNDIKMVIDIENLTVEEL